MLATVNLVCVPPILQFTWEACVGSEFERKFVPVSVMLSVCDAEVLAGEVFGLMLVRVGVGFGGGVMMKAMGLEGAFFSLAEGGFKMAAGAPPRLAGRAPHTRAGTRSHRPRQVV